MGAGPKAPGPKKSIFGSEVLENVNVPPKNAGCGSDVHMVQFTEEIPGQSCFFILETEGEAEGETGDSSAFSVIKGNDDTGVGGAG